MKKNILKKASIGIALGLMLLPFLALAQGPVPGQQVDQVPGPIITTPGQITGLITHILNWVGGIVFTIGLIMLLWAAILFLTAGTSETAHTKAKNVLIYAIIGIAVAILANSVRPFLIYIFGNRF